MGIKQRYSSQPVEIKVAIIGGLVTLLCGIIGGVFALASAEVKAVPPLPTATATASATVIGSSTPLPAPSRAPTFTAPPSPAASACSRQLSLTGPSEGSSFTSGNEKTLFITGTACDLADDTGWLFDYDSADHYYYDDYPDTTPSAAVPTSQSGIWTYPDAAIGDSGDQRKLYVITLVLATPSCARTLRTTAAIDGDYKWMTLPTGCKVVGSRDIYVTYP
jgi:hypothetical protein